jgi:starch phosphorylase
VSALHTDLLKATVFEKLAKSSPAIIVNKTNGIAFRRWLYQANPKLTRLIVDAAGEKVLDDPARLKELERFAGDASFVDRAKRIRQENKEKLAALILQKTGVAVDPTALFDIHIKRIHEYKRQTLNLLETVALYQQIRAHPDRDYVPRVKIIAGKAAPSYHRAKLLIKWANDAARVINSDPLVGDRLKLVFIPNYNVSLAEQLIPAADLSEQISTAGMEASGTGNMKLSLNGALTIGTLDGANIEIREHVGAENFFLFGMTAAEVEERKQQRYQGAEAARTCPELQTALESLACDYAPDDPDRYIPLVESFMDYDPFMVGADFADYWRAQREVEEAWQQPSRWWRASILNTARMGWFSSDRAVSEYAKEIWNVPLA